MTVEQHIFEKRLDNLIEDGWRVLNSNFDPAAFANWRRKALDCVIALVGPSHKYALSFREYVEQMEPKSLLAGEAILMATKAQLAPTGFVESARE